MSDRTRSLFPVETFHETDESKVDLLSILCGTSTSRSCSMVRCRKKFRLEDGMRSRGPVSNTVKLSLPTWGGEISTIWSNACCWKLTWCTIFAICTSWNVAGLLGGSPQSAILSSVSQRNAVGKVAKIVQLIVGDSGVDRGGASWVCVHILPSRPFELNRQKHSAQKNSELLGISKNPSNLGRGQSQTSTCNLTVPQLSWSLPEQP